MMELYILASFSGLPWLRFLIACKNSAPQHFSTLCLHYPVSAEPGPLCRLHLLSFCMLQAIKNRSRGRPGNKASTYSKLSGVRMCTIRHVILNMVYNQDDHYIVHVSRAVGNIA